MIDIVEDVVVNVHVVKRAGKVLAIVATAPTCIRRGCRNTDPIDRMAHDVVAEDDVVDSTCGAETVLVLGIEENRRALLCLRPVVFKDVSLDEFAYSTLVFEQVLDQKSSTEV